MTTHKTDLSEVSTSQLSWLARCAHRTARRRLAEAGVRPVRTDGKTLYYDPRDALPPLLGVVKLDLSAERARLARQQADAQELKNAIARGEYVQGEQVDLFLLRLLGAFVQRIRSVPSKAAPEVRATGSDAEGEVLLRALVDEALEELAAAARAAGERVQRRGN